MFWRITDKILHYNIYLSFLWRYRCKYIAVILLDNRIFRAIAGGENHNAINMRFGHMVPSYWNVNATRCWRLWIPDYVAFILKKIPKMSNQNIFGVLWNSKDREKEIFADYCHWNLRTTVYSDIFFAKWHTASNLTWRVREISCDIS